MRYGPFAEHVLWRTGRRRPAMAWNDHSSLTSRNREMPSWILAKFPMGSQPMLVGFRWPVRLLSPQ